MCTPQTALESILIGRHTIGQPQQISDSVTAEPIVRSDGYRYGWRLACTGCGHEETRGRHTTAFPNDIPGMYAASHQTCASRPL